MEGGAETGFHHVEPEKYTPRLLHFSGAGKKVVVNQVSQSRLSNWNGWSERAYCAKRCSLTTNAPSLA